MIDYIRGTLTEKEPGYVTLEAHGVGYEVVIPLSTLERMPPKGGEAKLYTHHHVREDTQKLFGFVTRQERELFRQLITVSSIGPKTAIGILSKMSVEDFIRFVTLGDPSRFVKIPGIGAKTAERLIVELRGKLKVTGGDGVSHKIAGGLTPVSSAPGSREEAFEALISLGYNDKQVSRAIERVGQAMSDAGGYGVEDWIKKALQVI
jgi:Holliday junction DNA helicase RuvA